MKRITSIGWKHSLSRSSKWAFRITWSSKPTKPEDMVEPIYVIGHVNPDTDSIAAAVGYAWLLRERDGVDTVAARAGAINPQTTWVLKRLGLEPPLLLTDASPRFEAVTR